MNTVQRKMTIFRKDGSPSHQKSRFFITSKQLGLFLDIWHSRKALKSLLWIIYLMLDLLYHKHNHLITTVVGRSIFFKIRL